MTKCFQSEPISGSNIPFPLILRYAEKKRAGNRKTWNNVSDLSDCQFYAQREQIAIVFSLNLGLDCDVDFINLYTEILFAIPKFLLNLGLINLIIWKRKNHGINSTSLHSGWAYCD